jgi:hypothetical protein
MRPGNGIGIMAFDDNTYNATLTSVADSYNTDEETNTTNASWTATTTANTDNSVNDSGNAAYTATDSFHVDSYNTDDSMTNSGNTWTATYEEDDSDNSTNTYTDSSDHSINAGNRSYSLGAGGDGAAAAGAGSATVIDQSLNANIAADGPVLQHIGSTAIVGSGADSMVAGGDIDVSYDIDQSTNFSADGDILIDSTKNVTEISDSYNTANLSWEETDNSIDVDIDDSYNTWTHDTAVTDSFNQDYTETFDTSITVDLDAIVHSDGAAIADDLDVGF